MASSYFELNFSLPTDGRVSRAEATHSVRNSGAFGIIDETANDSYSLLAYVQCEIHDDEQLMLPLRNQTNDQEVTLSSDIQGYIDSMAKDLGAEIHAYEPVTEVIYNSQVEVDELAFFTEEVEEDTNDVRALYVAFGKPMGPPNLVSERSQGFAHEVSRDVKGPATAVVTDSHAVAFVLEGFDGHPTWVDRKPVVELISHGLDLSVRWHSAVKNKGSLKERLISNAFPREFWRITTGPTRQENLALIVERDSFDGLPSIFEAQNSLREDIARESGGTEEEIANAQALAIELGLDASQQDRLVQLLTSPSLDKSVSDVIAALGLPADYARAFTGEIPADSLDNAFRVEAGSIAGTMDFGSFIERPTGHTWSDRLRRMDFDQPALSLVLEVAMVALGVLLFLAGVFNWGVFATTWVAIVGYIFAAWMLIDGLASLWVWGLIRKQNRAG